MNVIEVYVVGQVPSLYEDGRHKGEHEVSFSNAGQRRIGGLRFTWDPLELFFFESPDDPPVLVNGKVVKGRGKPVHIRIDASGVEVGTRRASVRLADGDVVACGPAVFCIRTVPPATGDEHAVFAALQTDADKRAVYADWLESGGAVQCAEYVRLVVEPGSLMTRRRLAALRARVARSFRATVAVGNIELCNQQGCPERWEKLTFNEGIKRTCQVCKATVSFIDELPDVKVLGPLVVVDPAVERTPDDLRNQLRPPRPPLRIPGRPLIVDGLPRTASAVGGGRQLDTKLIESLTFDALHEHASIATFARTLCELMALGAPHDLLVETQRALGDEVRHAEMTFAQIERFGGGARHAGPLPEATAPLRRSVAEFREDVRQGAAGEEEAVRVALERAATTSDPELRAFYLVIAEDEARHAALAHKTVRWLEERNSGTEHAPNSTQPA